MRRHIKIYDTTLRDGTQGEGVSFSMEDKVRIATRLDALGVHYIEGGWPGSNPKDLRFFRRMQDVTLKHARLAAFTDLAGQQRRTIVGGDNRCERAIVGLARIPSQLFSGGDLHSCCRDVMVRTCWEPLA